MMKSRTHYIFFMQTTLCSSLHSPVRTGACFYLPSFLDSIRRSMSTLPQRTNRASFEPARLACEVMVADPDASRKALTRKAMWTVKDGEWMNYAQSLPHHGELHRMVIDNAATLWSEAVQKLPPECL